MYRPVFFSILSEFFYFTKRYQKKEVASSLAEMQVFLKLSFYFFSQERKREKPKNTHYPKKKRKTKGDLFFSLFFSLD